MYRAIQSTIDRSPAFSAEVGRLNPVYASGATTACALTQAVRAGTRLVVLTLQEGTVPSSIADDAGNTYTKDVQTNLSSGTGCTMWSAPITTALAAGQNVTITWSVSTNQVHSCLLLAIGNATTVDVNNGTTGTPFTGLTDYRITRTPTASSVVVYYCVASADIFSDTASSFGTFQSQLSYAGNAQYGVVYIANVIGAKSTTVGIVCGTSHNAQVAYAFYK
jgi:hypothetical protein